MFVHAALDAASAIVGIEQSKLLASRSFVKGLGVATATEHLCQWDVDALVGANLMERAFDSLLARGVDRARLVKRLKRDPTTWAAWVEFRIGGLLSEYLSPSSVEFEPAGGKKKAPDYIFRDVVKHGDGHARDVAIEVKGIGLSAHEKAFGRRYEPVLESYRPSAGVVAIHPRIGKAGQKEPAITVGSLQRREQEMLAEAFAATVWPPETRFLSGAIAIGHDDPMRHTRRLHDLAVKALDQRRRDMETWIVFHWANGTWPTLVGMALKNVPMPKNVSTVGLVGSAVDLRFRKIVELAQYIRRDQFGKILVMPSDMEPLAVQTLDAVASSTGVRATILRAHVPSQVPVVVMRRIDQHTLPFILVAAHDPPIDQMPQAIPVPPRS
jgi:hypothetical protein